MFGEDAYPTHAIGARLKPEELIVAVVTRVLLKGSVFWAADADIKAQVAVLIDEIHVSRGAGVVRCPFLI